MPVIASPNQGQLVQVTTCDGNATQTDNTQTTPITGVVGTRVVSPPISSISILGQETLSPQTTQSYGSPLSAKLRSLSCRQGQSATIVLNLLDPIGLSVDLTNGGNILIAARFRESILGTCAAYSTNSFVTNTSAGLITVVVPPVIVQNPGIHWAEFGVYQTQNALVTVPVNSSNGNNFIYIQTSNSTLNTYLQDQYTVVVTTAGSPGVAILTITSGLKDNTTITPSAFGSPTTIGTKGLTITFKLDSTRPVDTGLPSSTFVLGQSWSIQVQPQLAFSNILRLYVEPSIFPNSSSLGTQHGLFPFPTIQQARMYLNDTDPSGNLLTQNYEFDVADLCEALEMCVRTFNQTQPPIDLFYDSISYPYFLPDGYVPTLMRQAAMRYMRNHLPYQGGGISIDDQNKFKEYFAIADGKWKAYTEFIRSKKIQLNAENAFGTVRSPYSFVGRYGWW